MRHALPVLALLLVLAAAVVLLRPWDAGSDAGGRSAQDAEGAGVTTDIEVAGPVSSPALAGRTTRPQAGPSSTEAPSPPAPGRGPAAPSWERWSLEPGPHDLTGRVLRAADGTPRWATVRIYGSGRRPVAYCLTDAEGRFHALLPTPIETLTIVVCPMAGRGEGVAPLAPLVLEGVAGGSRDVELALSEGAWIRGRMVDVSGEGISGFVQAYRPPALHLGRAETEPDGSFRIAVEPGRALVYAEPKGGGGAAATDGVEVFAPADDVLLVCPPTRTLRGCVQGEGDLRGFYVGWSHRLPDGSARGLWDAVMTPDGSFALDGAPRREVMLVAKRAEDPRCAMRAVGPEISDDLVLRLAEGLEIQGWLRTNDGTPLAAEVASKAYVDAWHAELGIHWNAPVAADGAFTLRGLPPGRYDLTAGVKGHRVERLHAVRAPATRLVLTVTR